MSKKPSVADTTLRNLHAQKKVNEHLKAQISSLRYRVADLERAIKYVLKYARTR